MARFNDIINNFVNGEVSPRIYGRTDSEIYRRACKNIKNMIVVPQGGARRRVGSQFVTDEYSTGNETTSNTGDILALSDSMRLIPFVVSEEESYLILLTADYFDGLNQHLFYVYNVKDETFHPVALGIGDTVFSSSANTTTVLQDADKIKEIQYDQSGDVMIFAHKDMPPFYFVRTGVNEFTANEYVSTTPVNFSGKITANGAPFRDQNTSDTTLTLSAVTVGTGRTLTASDDVFNALHVGTMFAFQDSGTIGYAIVTAYSSATSVTVEIIQACAAAFTSGSTQWYECAWSDYRGWPRTVSFWQGRLVFGGNESQPDTLWTSQLGDVFEMNNDDVIDPGEALTEDDPQIVTVASDKVNEINWLVAGRGDLLFGSRGREYAASGLGIGTVSVSPYSNNGSEYVQPAVVDNTPIFVQRGFRKIRDMKYIEQIRGYTSTDLTFIAEHITKKSLSIYTSPSAPKIKGITEQRLDNKLLWAWDNNGYLYSCTVAEEGDVKAWHRHELGGVLSSDIPKVLSAASVPSKDGTYDELHLLVKRTVDSTEVVFWEKLGNDFFEESLHPDVDARYRQPVYMDAAKMFRTSGPATFYASLRSDADADTSDGTGTGTETGTITYARDKAQFDDGSASYIDWDGTDNADSAQVGCIRWDWWPSKRGTKQTMVSICKAASDIDNLIQVSWEADDSIGIIIFDSTGSSVINSTLSGIDIGESAPSGYLNGGTPYHFELNYDLTNGATRLFVNGKQLGTTFAATGTRDTSIDLIRMGAAYNAATPALNARGANLVIFDSVQHTADYEWYEYQGASTTIRGLDYLEGQTVKVLADGLVQSDKTVSSGSITLDDTYSTVIVGLSYEHLLEPLAINFGGAIGTRQGETTRLDRIVARFEGTAACNAGPTADDVDSIIFRDADTPLADPIALVTDDKEIYLDGDYGLNETVVFKGSDPLPCNITCIVARGIAYE